MNDRVCLALCFLLLLAPMRAAAQCDRAGLINAPIVFGSHERKVCEAGQLGPQERATILASPGHGQLRVGVDGRFYFAPAATFWSVGTDSFTAAISSPSGTTLKTIRLTAPIVREAESPLEEAEAAPSPGAAWRLEGNPANVAFTSEVALSGGKGMLILAGPSTDTYLASTPPEPPEPPAGIEGTGSSGSGGQGGWRPPGSGGGTGGSQLCGEESLAPCPFGEAIIASLAASTGHGVFARMRMGDAGIELRLEASGAAQPSAWVPVLPQPHQLTLLGWNDHLARPQGAALFLDGKLLASLNLAPAGLPSFDRLEARFGTMQAVGSVPAHAWDRLRAFSFRGPRPRAACLREDRFPTTSIASQWQLVNEGSVEINTDTVVSTSGGSSYSLAVEPAGAGTPPGGMIRATGFDPSFQRLGVRFRLGLEDLTLTEGSSIVLVDAAHLLGGTRAFRLVLARGLGGNLRLYLSARHNDSSQPAALTSVLLPAGSWHRIELDWQRSETTVAGTGHLRLWINGVEAAEHLSLANSALNLTDVRLGGVTQLGSAAGRLLVDDVELWTEP